MNSWFSVPFPLSCQGDECDTDKDGDGLDDFADNCPLVPNAAQTDLNGNIDA